MYFLPSLLILCFIIFLFCLYILSHDDYVFLRKNVSLEQIFNGAVLGFFVSIFFARLFYVLLNPNLKFLNPLDFFLFPYFPGLSIIGGVIGAALFLYLYFTKKKMPTGKPCLPAGRIFDFFCFSGLVSASFGYLIAGIWNLLNKRIDFSVFADFAVYFILLLLIIRFVLPVQRRGDFKDSSMGFLILFLFSLTLLITDIFSETEKVLFSFSKETFIYAAVFIFFLYLFNNQEKILQRIKIIKKK